MAVTDTAIEGIKQMIVTGEIKPGDRLPKEAELAVRLGLSRNSLREAVRALSLIHVLDVRQGDGTYVTSLSPSLLLETMAFIVDLHRDDSVLEFLEVRRVIEPAAPAMAAIRMPDDAVAALGRHLDRLGDDPSVEELVSNDIEFHRLIAEGSQNPVLCSLVESLSVPTQRARVWRGLTQGDAIRRTLDEHHAIFEGIRDRQPDVAAAAATGHIAGVEQWIRTALASA
jgi:GntR family transcriptional regulator, transcriptional repressor for pyruvate dehydrogenase complex